MVCMPVLKEEKGGGREIDRLMIIILLVVAKKKKRALVEVSKLGGPGLIECGLRFCPEFWKYSSAFRLCLGSSAHR